MLDDVSRRWEVDSVNIICARKRYAEVNSSTLPLVGSAAEKNDGWALG